MKIALISTFFHPVTGGVESHVLSLARELKALGHEVEILCSDSNKKGPRIRERKTVFLGVKVKRFFTLLNISYYHKLYPGLFFHLLKTDYDVVHVHGFRKYEVYAALLAKVIRKYKVVLTTHNPFPTSTRNSRLNLLVKLHDKTVGRLFTKKLDKIITLVESEKEIFTNIFRVDPKKITLIPNGVEESYYIPGNKATFYKDWNIDRNKWHFIAISVGRINFAKGFQNLKLAIRDHKKVLFIIVGGDDGYLEKLKFLFADFKNVFFTERFIAPDKLKDIYAAADVFLFPSFHEAFGIAMLEAMAQKLPVISTNVGGPAEIVKNNEAILLDPKDQEAWSESLDQLLKNGKLREQMSEKAFKLALDHNWKKIVKDVEKVYLELKTAKLTQ